jgi:hypothetical protein
MNADRLLTNVHCALATEILGVGWQPTEKDYDSSPAAVMGWWIPLHQVTDGWLFFMPGDAMILTNWAPTQVKNWLVVYTRPHINVCFQGRGTVPTGSRWHRFLRRFS